MDEIGTKWMTYIDAEVRAACAQRRWGYQVRRKWSVRDKPVSESSVDDYEWKLIPNADDQDTYYVLGFERRDGKFVFQHDTAHCGIEGPHWNLRTYTEIDLLGILREFNNAELLQAVLAAGRERITEVQPPAGWLRRYLVDLTARFKPNEFSVT